MNTFYKKYCKAEDLHDVVKTKLQRLDEAFKRLTTTVTQNFGEPDTVYDDVVLSHLIDKYESINKILGDE